MVTFQTVGDPLVQISQPNARGQVNLSIKEALDPTHPYINIMAGSYEYEDDADPGDMATLCIHEPKGQERDLVSYAEIPISTASRTNKPKSSATWHLLMNYHDIITGKGSTSVRAWRPYRIQVYPCKYVIQYYNNILNDTGIIQLSGGDLLIEDGDKCLTLQRHLSPVFIQINFVDSSNNDNRTFISLFKEQGELGVCRTYCDIPYNEVAIMNRALGQRYNYRALRI